MMSKKFVDTEPYDLKKQCPPIKNPTEEDKRRLERLQKQGLEIIEKIKQKQL